MHRETSRDAVVLPMGLESKSYECVRTIAEHGLRPIVASEYDTVPAAGSRFCSETATVPSPETDLLAYRDALLELAASPDVATILPLRSRDTYLFSKYQSEFEEHISLVTPPMDLLRTVHDRTELVAAAERAGVAVPETGLLSEWEDRDREVIVKSRYNLLVDEYLDGYSERESATEDTVTHRRPGEELAVAELTEEMGHDPIVQEYIPSSHEYVFGALYDHGEPLATFQHRQIRGDSYTGGGGVYRKSTDIDALERVGRQLLGELDYHGLACIEYMKHAETGEYYLTEINPRLWQSVPCAIRAGAEFPWYYYLQATDQTEQIDPDYEVGFGTHQIYGEFNHLKSLFTDESSIVDRPSIPGTLRDVVVSCYEDPRFDDLRLDDPRPFLRAVSHVLSRQRQTDHPVREEDTDGLPTVADPLDH